VFGADHAYGSSLVVEGSRLFDCFVGQWTGGRDELHRNPLDEDVLLLGDVTVRVGLSVDGIE
jgi:hypothetical protein